MLLVNLIFAPDGVAGMQHAKRRRRQRAAQQGAAQAIAPRGAIALRSAPEPVAPSSEVAR
jgi:hypothetical protein